MGDLVRAAVAVVDDVLDVIGVAQELLSALADRGEAAVHGLGNDALELAAASHADLVGELLGVAPGADAGGRE